jgi:hypothetical protein
LAATHENIQKIKNSRETEHSLSPPNEKGSAYYSIELLDLKWASFVREVCSTKPDFSISLAYTYGATLKHLYGLGICNTGFS